MKSGSGSKGSTGRSGICRRISASGSSSNMHAWTFLSPVTRVCLLLLNSSTRLRFLLMPSTSLTTEYSPMAAPSCSLEPAILAMEESLTSVASCTHQSRRLFSTSIGPSYSFGTIPSTSDSKNDSRGNHIRVLRIKISLKLICISISDLLNIMIN